MQFSIALVCYIGVMVLALAGMFYCAKKQKQNPNVQTYAIICLLFVLASAVGVFVETGVFGGSSASKKLIANEIRYARSGAFVIGDYLGKKFPGAQVLIIVNADYDKNEHMKKINEGLLEGLGATVKILAQAPLEPPKPAPGAAPQEYVPMEAYMTAERFDAILDKYPTATLVISTIGLPYNVGEMKLWGKAEAQRPKLALLNGDVHSLGAAIASKAIVAAVVGSPEAKYSDAAAPVDPQEAFKQRYLLVTPENVEATANKYQSLFAR